MSRLILTLLVVLLSLLPAAVTAQVESATPAEPCRVHVARRSPSGFEVAPITVATGETLSLRGGEDGLVAVLLPPGPGGSASLESTRGDRTFRLACSEDLVELTVLGDDGLVTSLPPRRREDLAREDIRVSLTAADGSGASFLIRGNSRVSADAIGPHLDPFAGKVPMGPEDVVVFTRTTTHDDRPSLAGRTSLRLEDGHLYSEAVLPDGRSGRFVLDLAAGTSLLARPWLPEGTEIRKVEMVEHSAAGRRTLAYSMDGATGSLGGLLGQADLARLRLGGIDTGKVTVSVMDGPMKIGEREVAGILGTDILLRCGALSLAYGGNGTDGSLELDAAPPARGSAAGSAPVEIPFVRIGGLIYLRGEINGVDTRFILDSGASRCFLDSRTAAAAGLEPGAGGEATVKGLDGRGATAWKTEVPVMRLADREFRQVPFDVADLTPFAMIGAGQNPGLLGNTFLGRFERIELDLAAGVLRLHPRAPARAAAAR